MRNYLTNILTLFKNVVLNATGIERTFLQRLQDGDVTTAINMMQNRDEDVDNAISEYNPQTHKIMKRPDKLTKGDTPLYRTEKLPRSRQRYINEVELFFLFGKNVKWTQRSGTSEAYNAFNDFLTEMHFNARTRTAKRLAGSETECAKLYDIYKDFQGKIHSQLVVLARSKGYQLRPMFDKFGALVAFAYGYRQKENGKTIQHWDVQTPQLLFYCAQNGFGWDVQTLPNPTGKINVIYVQQPKAWDGVEPRLEREEMLDSKVADTNNYFADPIAAATADVIQSMLDPNKPGKLIQLGGANSRFEYINPPQQSEIRRAEKDELEKSILFDTFTPDLGFEALRGLGTLSGAAIRNSFILGYMKRDRNIEVYGELMEREKNLMIEILKYTHAEIDWKDFDVDFEFAEPFSEDNRDFWQSISSLYGSGLVSLDTAVDKINLVKDKDAEIDKIMCATVEENIQAENAQEEEPVAPEGKPVVGFQQQTKQTEEEYNE